jgi:2-polyprenyl-3-methyl-5-hydroxy-6-metoxy-1,4-benzoquinol methylase
MDRGVNPETQRSCRARLYERYSGNFGGGKPLEMETQFRQFDVCYRGLLPPHAAAIGDLGCGKGEWLAWLRREGRGNLFGVDCSPSDLEVARAHLAGVELIGSGIVEALRAKPGHFDLLHAKDVVEHLTPDELFEFLDACHAALKPGGQLWMLTYNAQSPFANATRYGDFTHEIGLTPSSMAQVLTAAGFVVDRVDGIHVCPPSATGTARRLVWKMCTPFFRLLLKARHGGGGGGKFDSLASEPDLFAVAHKADINA